MKSKYFSKDGLLNSKLIFDRGTEENAPLWTIQYLSVVGPHLGQSVLLNMAYWMKGCLVSPGLYNQTMEKKDNHDDYTSPDQLIAYMCFNEMAGLYKNNRAIWRWLLTHWFTYDNLSQKTNFKRLIQPTAVLLAAVEGSFLGVLFLPFLSMALIISCFSAKGETSGKLKAWTIATTFEMSITYRIMSAIIRVDYSRGWKEVFAIYFPDVNHPTRIALRQS